MTGILVHEWLEATGGSENVFEHLSQIFPEARRFCLWNNSHGRFTNVRETFLASTPLRHNKALALPLMPIAWRSLPRMKADWVLCSSHAFAHHANFHNTAPKLVYAHTPARYIWNPELDSRGDNRVTKLVSAFLKPIDRRTATSAESVAANSNFVAQRIRDTWGVESRVIYPPVDVSSFMATPTGLTPSEHEILSSLPDSFLLGASRFVPYKQLDRVILTGAAAQVPVVLAGEGPDEVRLRTLAARHPGLVTFVPRPSFALLRALYHYALALVFAPIEDFGIMPVEAMAAGTPVIANAIGGASESVLDGTTGVHIHDWRSTSELCSAVEVAASADPVECSSRAELFSRTRFTTNILNWVETVTS